MRRPTAPVGGNGCAGEFLAAAKATGQLRQAAVPAAGDAAGAGALSAAARDAVGDSGIYEARERVLLAAPPSLAAAAERAFQAVIRLRDAVMDGAQAGSPRYRAAYLSVDEAIWLMRQAARANVGAELLDVDALARDERSARGQPQA